MSEHILSIDQSTSATKALLIDSRGEILRAHSLPHRQCYPQPGYIEHDAEEIYQNVLKTMEAVRGGARVSALALCNQRETVVFWDRETGAPLCPAVVWQDLRAEALCQALTPHAPAILKKTGMALSPYYSAAKAAHVLRAHPEWDLAQVCVGTMDSYLVFRLTGGASFKTDSTNASRTQLMNLRTLSWDQDICRWMGIPLHCLPEIVPADSSFGSFQGIPIAGVLGDSQAALFGHGCFAPGMVKASFGTGSSVMMNIGPSPLVTASGLTTSVGFQFQGETHYVLEGNVTASGDTLCWLRDGLRILDDIGAIEEEAAPDAQGVYLVPAFAGLGAPHFDETARAVLCGMNRGTERAHVLRAGLESMAFQDADVLAAMARDTGITPACLRADGGGAKNKTLMRFLAGLLDCPVETSAHTELSALGVAYLAGVAAGIYESMEKIPARRLKGATYAPEMSADTRRAALSGWRAAVHKAKMEG